MKTAEQIMAHVRSKLHQGTCPAEGALGELLYLSDESLANDLEQPMFDTALSVWGNNLTATQVATWFKEAGAAEVHIAHTLHDDFNQIREGRDIDDGTRLWEICFWLPAPAAATKPTPRTCREAAGRPH